MASAEFNQDAVAVDAVKEIMGSLGRSLVRDGEAVYEIVVNGNISLRQACGWQIAGDVDPATWSYDIELPAPSGTVKKTVEGAGVLHFVWAVNPAEPWKGLSPAQSAPYSFGLLANLERQLMREAGGPAGSLIPSERAANQKTLQADINKLTGQVSLAPVTRSGPPGTGNTPRNDYQLVRLGLRAPESTVGLRTSVILDCLQACGLPAGLVSASSPAAAREAYRQYVAASVVPRSRGILAEIEDKLELTGLDMSFAELNAADVTSKARGAASLVSAGMAIDEALEAGGFGLMPNCGILSLTGPSHSG